jgi:hypothetical protein
VRLASGFGLILDNSAATDGKHIILAMLIVGLIFLAVIGLGELTKAIGDRRHDRKRRALES